MAHSDEIKKAQDAVLVLVKDLEDALGIANLQISELSKANDTLLTAGLSAGKSIENSNECLSEASSTIDRLIDKIQILEGKIFKTEREKTELIDRLDSAVKSYDQVKKENEKLRLMLKGASHE